MFKKHFHKLFVMLIIASFVLYFFLYKFTGVVIYKYISVLSAWGANLLYLIYFLVYKEVYINGQEYKGKDAISGGILIIILFIYWSILLIRVILY